MENIRLIFVLPEKYNDYKEASEIMVQAFEACKQTVKSDVTWIKENDFKTITLNKTDFVIFEEFKGDTFEKLKETKCARILGPWAISICLMEGKSVPNFPWPIYNVAMYGCIVTCSNLSKTVKMQIKEMVQIMGGCYVDTLVEKITHLVTNNPNSEKYLIAAETGVKIMCSSWIDAVWEASQTVNVHADDNQFDENRCLPFQNLSICCTGITNSSDRKDLELKVNKYGGRYSGKLDLMQTDILVCVGLESSLTEKYKAARKRKNIKCVNMSWINDSIQKGYALPHHLYQVQKVTSTPTKHDAPVNPDFSVLSAICVPNTSQRLNIEESINATSSPRHLESTSRAGTSKRKGNLKEDYGQLVEKLDIKRAKKAGQYLDGCSVYITGFGAEHFEKLSKVVNLSGATRYDQFSDRVTHVIVGDPNSHEVKLIKSKGGNCLLVTVQWLLESLENKQPVSEEKYLLNSFDFDKSGIGSPLSKKCLSLLRSNKTIAEHEVEETKENTANPTDNVDDEIIQRYLKTTATVHEDDTEAMLIKAAEQFEELPNEMQQFQPSNTSTQQSSMPVTQDESSQAEIFEGLKFLLSGFEEEDSTCLKKMIEDFSGEVVSKNFKGIPDYAVVPAFNKFELKHTTTEVINELFIHECCTEGVLLDKIEYYHRPCVVINMEPLENCVVTISSYSSYQRNFLQGLIEALGGLHQEQFSRITSEAKGVVASTHLVSDEASGKKYIAALKWNLPVINKDWLLDCAKTGTRVPEQDYLVGESKAPKRTDDSKNSSSATSAPDANNATNVTKTKIATPDTSFIKTRLNSSALNTSNVNVPSSSNAVGAVCDNSIITPNKQNNPNNSGLSTPVNQLLSRQLSFNDSRDKMFSQVTPVNKIVQQYRESNTDGTPAQDSPEKFRFLGIRTPDTPLGACIQANPTPQMKKDLEYWIRTFPDYEPPKQRRLSTPLSELKRQLWDKILHRDRGESQQTQGRREGNEPEEMEAQDLPPDVAHSSKEGSENRLEPPPGRSESTQNRLIDSRLQQLEEMLGASGGGRRQSRNFQSTIPIPEGNNEYKDSQAGTVGWDFKEQEVAPKQKIFSLSGIGDPEVRATMVQQLESLGASVSDLANYDPSSTHLLSPKPARNEKTLSFMAAGKWILHTSYLEKSFAEGYFLNEEDFEYGNPKSVGKFEMPSEKDIETRMRSMYWWRNEVTRRGYGAFNDMRAIVVAQKRDLMVRVIQAGGGTVIDVSPPFENDVHATHCLLEPRSVRDMADYVPLAQQGIFLLNTLFISDFLHNPKRDVKECILQYFAKYYSKS